MCDRVAAELSHFGMRSSNVSGQHTLNDKEHSGIWAFEKLESPESPSQFHLCFDPGSLLDKCQQTKVLVMSTPIPQPKGIPLLGNIFDVNPNNAFVPHVLRFL